MEVRHSKAVLKCFTRVSGEQCATTSGTWMTLRWFAVNLDTEQQLQHRNERHLEKERDTFGWTGCDAKEMKI